MVVFEVVFEIFVSVVFLFEINVDLFDGRRKLKSSSACSSNSNPKHQLRQISSYEKKMYELDCLSLAHLEKLRPEQFPILNHKWMQILGLKYAS